jgi:hypothetical protein
MNSGIDYWVWVQPGTTITLDTCRQTLACQVHRGVTSPFLVLGLVNGVTYSVIVNASNGGSPVGDNSPPISFVPNPVGSIWTPGTPLASTLLGVSYTGASTIASTAFVAVGTGGALYSSANGTSWTALTSNVATNLNAVQFGDSRFVVVGDAGVMLSSVDATTWAPLPVKYTSNNLYALTFNGAHAVAVGANGVILTSGDGLAWALQNSGTSKDLFGIIFANSLYVAVGAEGTLLTSSDGLTWQARSSPTSLNLKSIAYGAGKFVAVGASGTLVTSTDGVTWTAGTPIAANSFSSVVYGTQFVAAGTGGGIFTSVDGVTWVPVVSGTTSDLNAVTFSFGLASSLLNVGYVAVGAAGVNLTAF